MKFIITEEEKNRIKTLYNEQGIMDKVKDLVNPTTDKTFIKDTTILPIKKRVDFYDYTRTKTLKGVEILEGVFNFNNLGNGYLIMKCKTGDGKQFSIYSVCVEDGGEFYATFLMPEADYKAILNVTDPMSKTHQIGDDITGEFVELTNGGFFNYLTEQMKSKKAKTFCKAKQSDFTSTQNTSSSDFA
jgi:hypothetical protein